ncbi:MAG: amino acid ABC transporter substrate-binding protein [Deltaproteobacteria bacterium]|nr:amino acid ABC transporter substrate-binding protein [Deltaproteobacteria bacterium]
MKKIVCLALMIFMVSLSSAFAKNFEILTGEWAPYVSKSMKDGGPTAIIVSQVLKAVGHTASFKYVPWKRTEVLTQQGKAVATFPWSATDEFKKKCYLSTPIATQKMVFFYIKDKLGDWDYTGLDQLKKLKVGGSEGYSYVGIFKSGGVKAEYGPNTESSLKKLVHGRIDVVPESQLVGWQVIKSKLASSKSKFATSKTPLFTKALHLMVSKAHPDGKELIDAYEKGFKIIKANGIYKKILEEYGLSE